jgi:hypothetical protein
MEQIIVIFRIVLDLPLEVSKATGSLVTAVIIVFLTLILGMKTYLGNDPDTSPNGFPNHQKF